MVHKGPLHSNNPKTRDTYNEVGVYVIGVKNIRSFTQLDSRMIICNKGQDKKPFRN